MLRRSGDVKKIYYLYIGDSNEDSELVYGLRTLSNAVPIITLRYLSGAFVHTQYEKLRGVVLDFVLQRKDDPRLLEVFNANLDRALLRGDFLMQEAACKECMQKSQSVTERNYWVCVLYAIHARTGRL